jgi:hypothetical protein
MRNNSTPPRWRWVEGRCERCGQAFVRKGGGRFCGSLCYHASQGSADHFWSRVDRSAECWVWTGGTVGGGYGRFGRGKVLAHRHAWEITNGPIPDGLDVLHRCDNPPCVRPDHLFLGTHTDNMRDMFTKGRRATKRGTSHPNARMTEEDVRWAKAEYAKGGTTIKHLAASLGVSKSTLRVAIRGIRWQHVA